MKKLFKVACLGILAVATSSCNNMKSSTDASTDTVDNRMDTTMMVDNEMVDAPAQKVKSGSYVDLKSGEKINIMVDPKTGLAVNSKTNLPVEFYYDPISKDTLYQNGFVVNRMLINDGDGKYHLDGMKIKIVGDKIKIKTDSTKFKSDNNTMKFKSDDEKMKSEDDESKLKTEDEKMKMEDGQVKTKPN